MVILIKPAHGSRDRVGGSEQTVGRRAGGVVQVGDRAGNDPPDTDLLGGANGPLWKIAAGVGEARRATADHFRKCAERSPISLFVADLGVEWIEPRHPTAAGFDVVEHPFAEEMGGMVVDVDQSGDHQRSGGVDYLGTVRLGCERCGLANAPDALAFHQDGAVRDDMPLGIHGDDGAAGKGMVCIATRILTR